MQVRDKVEKSRQTGVYPMLCGSGGSKSRLAKATGAEPSGQMRDEKLHAVVARSTFRSQNIQDTPFWEHFWKLWWWNVHAVVARSAFPSQKLKKPDGLRPLVEVEMMKKCTPLWHCGAKQISKSKCTKHFSVGPLLEGGCQKRAKRQGFVPFLKTMASLGHLQKICTDASRLAGAVQETCSSDVLGGPGADFLKKGAFWSIIPTALLGDFAWQVQHFVWPGITFSWQAQHSTQMKWKNRETHWYEASSAFNFLFLKEVSQNSFIIDVVKFKSWGSLAAFLRFWCCQV